MPSITMVPLFIDLICSILALCLSDKLLTHRLLILFKVLKSMPTLKETKLVRKFFLLQIRARRNLPSKTLLSIDFTMGLEYLLTYNSTVNEKILGEESLEKQNATLRQLLEIENIEIKGSVQGTSLKIFSA